MNVLIVDDEPVIRAGMKRLVEWESHGFALAGEASDGIEALEMIGAGNVDILITDLLMPRMDGLELMRVVRGKYPEVGMLVLSCMDDFAYVKEAMKLGAYDYILKPTMEPESLIAVVASVAGEMRQRREAEAEVRKRLEQSRQVQVSLRLQAHLMSGDASDEALEAELFQGQTLYSLLLYLPPPCKYELQDLFAEGCMAVVPWMGDRLLLLFPMSGKEGADLLDAHADLDSHAQLVAVHLRQTIEYDWEGRKWFIEAGPALHDLHGLQEALEQLEGQLSNHYYGDIRLAAVDPELLGGQSTEAPLPYPLSNDLLRAIRGGNEDGYLHQAEMLLAALQRARPSVVRLQQFICELLGMAAGSARESGNEGLDDYLQQYASMSVVQSCSNMEELSRFFLQALRELNKAKRMAEGVMGLLEKSSNPFVRKSISYMAEHYSRPITTTDIADHVRLSRSYLSDLFSRETGESLSDALTGFRIAAAKRLLLSDELKIYKVAEQVGFIDAKSFAKTFKRLVGCTPKEYVEANK